ncbi:MAG: helix-turn-helix domain-containing protein [Candidatus Cybelea sp.]
MPKFSEPRLRNRVREYRRLLSITQEELAAAAGITRIAVTRLDGNRTAMPSLPTALRLAAALGISVKELVEDA